MKKNKIAPRLRISNTGEYLVLSWECNYHLRISVWYKMLEDGSCTIFKGKYSFFKPTLTSKEVSHLYLTEDITIVLNAASEAETPAKIHQIWGAQYHQWLKR